MANMADYLAWRGDISLEKAPWNEIDGLLAATLSYLEFHGGNHPRGWTLEEMARIDLLQQGDSASFPGRKDAFLRMAESERFRGARMHHTISLTDKEIGMQFSATCLDLQDGVTCVVFRGTDNTIVGWREDFNMAFTTRVPAQEAAQLYLNRAAELSDRPLRLIGHSKGGNLAVFAAACAAPEVQDRIESIWVYDAPGMNLEISRSEGFLRIREKIRSYIPQTSIIGLLMDYPRPYTVVHSTAGGIQQHDIMSWEVLGPRFEELESIDDNAVTIRDTLQEWLQKSEKKERAAFLEAAYRMVDSTKATTVGELMGDKMKNLRLMMGERRDMKPETKKDFNKLMSLFLSLGMDNVMDNVMDKVRLRFGDRAEGEEEQEHRALAEAAEAELVRRNGEKPEGPAAEKPEAAEGSAGTGKPEESGSPEAPEAE